MNRDPIQVINTATIKVFKMEPIQDNMVYYAFRYCLGRRTYCVVDCVEYLKKNWNLLSNHTKNSIKTDITEALDKGDAGMQMDIELWNGILNLN